VHTAAHKTAKKLTLVNRNSLHSDSVRDGNDSGKKGDHRQTDLIRISKTKPITKGGGSIGGHDLNGFDMAQNVRLDFRNGPKRLLQSVGGSSTNAG
jgi:hypothetical protein